MNGIHDLGGMDGFTLPERDQGRVLKEEWERLYWGTTFALRGVPGMGGGMRRDIERIPPATYLSLPYYAKWLYVTERALLAAGLVTEEELKNPDGPLSMPNLRGFQPAAPAAVLGMLRQDSSTQLNANVPARFSVGDAVAARNEHPPGHTRAPRYVRGRRGTVVRAHGVHRFDDETPGVEPGPQHLYTVVFSSRELWGRRGHVNDRIHVELWDYHLEPAA